MGVKVIQIQLSTHQFRIFYGETFGDHLAAVIDAIGLFEIDFRLQWDEDFCLITMDRHPSKGQWRDILEHVFEWLNE